MIEKGSLPAWKMRQAPKLPQISIQGNTQPKKVENYSSIKNNLINAKQVYQGDELEKFDIETINNLSNKIQNADLSNLKQF